MARLSNEEITNLIYSKGYTPIDITGYQNKNSNIIVQCKNKHLFTTSIHELERKSFQCPKCVQDHYMALTNTGEVPEKQGYRIVAFDQASEIIGVSVYDDGKLVYYDLYQLSGELDERLAKWYHLLNDTVVPEWKPDYLMFEDIQYQKEKGVITFKVLSMVLGIGKMVAELHQIPHSQILNKVWQSDFNITGSTRVAQKKNVVHRVKEFFNVDVTDDIGDAILIGLYAARKLYSNWEVSDF